MPRFGLRFAADERKAAHEVSIGGHHLRRIETVMQRMELSLLAKLPTGLCSVSTEGQPMILEIVVTKAKPTGAHTE